MNKATLSKIDINTIKALNKALNGAKAMSVNANTFTLANAINMDDKDIIESIQAFAKAENVTTSAKANLLGAYIKHNETMTVRPMASATGTSIGYVTEVKKALPIVEHFGLDFNTFPINKVKIFRNAFTLEEWIEDYEKSEGKAFLSHLIGDTTEQFKEYITGLKAVEVDGVEVEDVEVEGEPFATDTTETTTETTTDTTTYKVLKLTEEEMNTIINSVDDTIKNIIINAMNR